MRQIEAHFTTGQDFFNDYKFFLGAIAVPMRNDTERVAVGERIVMHCRFGPDKTTYDWSGLVLENDARSRGSECSVVVKFDRRQLDEIEQVVWSHTPGPTARQEARLEPLFDLRFIAEHLDRDDSRSVRAEDISRNGCQLFEEPSAAPAFTPNDPVRIQWANGETTGRVRWVRGKRFGVAFDAPLGDVGSLMCFEPA